jgi:competence protein ComGC
VLRDGLLDRPRMVRRPATVEILVVLEVVALLVAVALFSLTPDRPVSCQAEVTTVRNAIAQYRLGLGNDNPKNMFTLVGLGLLKTAPGPDSPSVKAGFVYDAKYGTYAGGTCPQ